MTAKVHDTQIVPDVVLYIHTIRFLYAQTVIHV